jgi:hypothetical protein
MVPSTVRAVLTGLTSATVLACAIQQTDVPHPELVADAAVGPFEITVPIVIPAQPDVSYWEARTSLPELVFDAHIGGFMCGLVYSAPAPDGQWVLVGVTENPKYTPILDIYGERSGNGSSNDTVYYHFRVRD